MNAVLITINRGIPQVIGGTKGIEVYIVDYDTKQEPIEVSYMVLKEMTKKEIKQFIENEIHNKR